MIPAVYPGSRLSDFPAESEALHFVRPVKRELLAGLLRKCQNAKRVTLSKSCLARMTDSCKRLLQESGVAVQIEKRQGRAISLPLPKMLHALEMRKDFQPLREIERVTGVPKSTIHYLARYSKRAKVKNGKRIIYLK